MKAKPTHWHWTARATAAGAAAAATAHAGTVQIPLGNTTRADFPNFPINTIGTTAPDPAGTLDLTGDGVDDLFSLVNAFQTSNPIFNGGMYLIFNNATTGSPGLLIDVGWETPGPNSTTVNITIPQATTISGSLNAATRTGLVPVTFIDARINSGVETKALLEIQGRFISRAVQEIELIRLIFDDTDPAQPTDAMIGGTKPQWVDPAIIAQRAKLQRQIKKKQRALRRAQKAGNRNKIRRLKQQIRSLKKRLRSL